MAGSLSQIHPALERPLETEISGSGDFQNDATFEPLSHDYMVLGKLRC